MKAILGIKKEMTQIFDKTGKVIPVTLIDTKGCRVVGKKSFEKDGYTAIKLGLGVNRNASRPETGKYKGGKVPSFVKEIKTKEEIENGMVILPTSFEIGDKVKVMGVSKGKGFAGVMKRWHFKGTGQRTHGQSTKPRHPGSIGAGTTPGRVLKGKKMAGRMGNDQVTIKGVSVVFVDDKTSLIGLKGMVPGAKGSVITITK